MKKAILMSLLSFMVALTSFGQITTSTLSGVVKNEKGETLAGATVHAVHQPSGSEYRTSSTKSGLYTIPAVRVGGPYIIHVSYVGYKMAEITDIQTLLGSTSNVDVVLLSDSKQLSEVTVVGTKSNVFSKDKTGAAQQFGRRELTSIPIAGARTIDGITKYNPFGNGNSFGAQDSRLNNFTIDGSQFNNNFGLGSSAQAGGRTGASAISLDAIDQLQVNVAPFDIRQSGFVGAGINAVTRSGTNEVEGSVYQTQRNNSSTYVGNNARGTTVTAAKFDEKVQGFRLGAPIIKNKLFIFGNYESIVRTDLVYGGNERTRFAGEYYYRYPSAAIVGGVPSATQQLDPTITGVNYANQLVQNIITNVVLSAPSTSVLNAASLLKTNRAFLQQNTVDYANETYPNLDYIQSKCYRDTGFIVDAVITDLVYGGNERSITAGRFYYLYPSQATGVQSEETIDSLNFTKGLAKLVAIGGKSIEDGFDIVAKVIFIQVYL